MTVTMMDRIVLWHHPTKCYDVSSMFEADINNISEASCKTAFSSNFFAYRSDEIYEYIESLSDILHNGKFEDFENLIVQYYNDHFIKSMRHHCGSIIK